jgi:hypothetical protein
MNRKQWLERAKAVLSEKLTYKKYITAIRLHNAGHLAVFGLRDDWEPFHKVYVDRRERWLVREVLRSIGQLMLMQRGVFQGDPEWDPIWNEPDE